MSKDMFRPEIRTFYVNITFDYCGTAPVKKDPVHIPNEREYATNST